MASLISRLLMQKSHASRRRSSRSRRQQFVARPTTALEVLERRLVLSAISVTNDTDIVNGEVSSITALLNDPGSDGISLREAIEAANNTPGFNEVAFDATLAGSTITLGGGQLVLADDVSIVGLGADELAINGNKLSRVFYVDPDVTAQISGLEITGGREGTDDGGAIFNQGTMTIIGSTIHGNQGRRGGGIWNASGGVLEIGNSTIRDNLSQASGGGIYNDAGTVSIEGTTIRNNQADYDGGGLLNTGTMSLTNGSVLQENLADNAGGGLYNAVAGTLVVDASDITGNTATLGGGGAVNGSGATLEIFNSTVSGNKATASLALGGGIHNSGVLTVSGSEIRENVAEFRGGGIWNDNPTAGGITTITASVIRNNTSVSGGGVFNLGTIELADATIRDNSADHGGGIYSQGELTVAGNTIHGNSAIHGGGIFAAGLGTEVTITNSTISGNVGDEGGGLYLATPLTVVNSTITGNSANIGGGLFSASTNTTVALQNTIVAGNWAGNLAGSLPSDIEYDFGTFNSTGSHNLIGDPATSGTFTHGVSGNIVGQDDGSGGRETIDINTVLDTDLANHGGPTLTHSLVSSSPAIDAGDNVAAVDPNGNPLTTDQRGVPYDRIVTGTVDIGAYESMPDPTPVGGVIVVDHFEDVLNPLDGRWSLREAIIHANSNAGDFEIQLQAGTYWLTIDGLGEDLAATGDLDVLSNGAVTIVGAGAEQTIINAGGDGGGIPVLGDRVFQVHNGGELIVEGLTVTGGTAIGLPYEGGNGGGIHVEAGTLLVTDSTLSHNSAEAWGGGIYNTSGGSVTVIGSTLFQNSAAGTNGGGGIYNSSSSVTVTDSTLSQNSASSRGGGIWNSGSDSSVTVTGSTLSQNSAQRGGGIYNLGSTSRVTVIDSTLSQNSANTDGGAILNTSSGSVIVTSSTLSENSAQRGGGIYNVFSSVTVTSSTLSENSASADGGGIFNTNSGSVTVTNSTLSENLASGDGGGNFNQFGGSLTVASSTLTGNRADADGSGSGGGGGLRMTNATATLQNTIVAGNFRGTGSTPDDMTNDFSLDSSSSYNLIGDPDTAGNLPHGTNGNILGDGNGNLLPISQILDTTLADNGGPTLTHALVPGSVAINAGDPNFDDTNLPYDQRGEGFDRVHNGRVDIGAFEFEVLNQPPVADSGGPYEIVVGELLSLDASQSSDPDGDLLTFSWDLTGDGDFDDAAGEMPELAWDDLVELGITGPGSYSIAVKADDGSATDEISTTLTVLAATPSLTIDWTGGTYNAGQFVATGAVLGFDDSEIGTPTFTYFVGSDTSGTELSTAPVDAGTYTVLAEFNGDALHTAASTTETITIGQAPLTITVDNQSKTYDGQAFEDFTVGYSGFVGSEDETVLSGTLDFGGSALGAVDAGSYGITAEGLTSNNYTITFEPGTLTIEKANATIDVSGANVTYDGSSHGATGSASGVNDETLTGLDLGASFINVPGGTANWTFTDVTGNYNDASGTVEIVINKATLTVDVDDAQWEIGTPFPVFSGTLSGQQNDESFAVDYSSTGNPTSTAGQYPITADVSGDTLANYEVIVNQGTLTIDAAQVDIDILPSNINIDRNGAISLVIFGSSQFDASQVILNGLAFAGVEITTFNQTLVDQNNDGHQDLMLHFKMTDDLRASLLEIYGSLLEDNYDGGNNSKQESLLAVDGFFGEYEQEFTGEDAVDIFLAGKSFREFLKSLDL